MLALHGVFTALITPFKNGALDLDALKRVTERQLKAGVHGLVPLGSTGESATLNFEERAEVIRVVLELAKGKVPVIVGTGTNSTQSTIEATRQAKELGADAAMVVSPYYNRPTPEGQIAHVEAVAQAVDIPLVMYNVPSRTGTNLTPDTAFKLSRLPYVVGLKEASGNMVQVVEILAKTANDWAVFSGEDALFHSFLESGAKGIICTTSNTAPERFVALYNAYKNGDHEGARRMQFELLPLINAHFMSTNPIPVKAAAHLLGLCENELRLPLLPLAGSQLETLRSVLAAERLL